jgi:hypothetical protein
MEVWKDGGEEERKKHGSKPASVKSEYVWSSPDNPL